MTSVRGNRQASAVTDSIARSLARSAIFAQGRTKRLNVLVIKTDLIRVSRRYSFLFSTDRGYVVDCQVIIYLLKCAMNRMAAVDTHVNGKRK